MAGTRVPEPGPAISRSEIVERAESWLRPSVPYSETRFHQNEYGIYRTDCSGYVSMAWGLPGIPPDRNGGLDTAGLAEISVPIGKGELRAGDIVLGWMRSIAIFHEWADPGHQAYWGFEQACGVGTVHRRIAYPHDRAADSTPCRYVRVIVRSNSDVGT